MDSGEEPVWWSASRRPSREAEHQADAGSGEAASRGHVTHPSRRPRLGAAGAPRGRRHRGVTTRRLDIVAVCAEFQSQLRRSERGCTTPAAMSGHEAGTSSEDVGQSPSQSSATGTQTATPRGSVLKKDSKAGRPVSVRFNLDQQDADPPRPMCIRLVEREYRAAVQQARAAEEDLLRGARRAYQDQLRRARDMFEDMVFSRGQYAARLSAARLELGTQVEFQMIGPIHCKIHYK